MLKMPIVWFDIPKNNPGGLTARLAADCKTVNGMTTTFIGVSIQNLVTLVASLIIGFIFEWRTSLVTVGLIPVMILAGALQMKQSLGFSGESDTAYKDSSSLITEAMVNIRTVMSFGYENVVLNKYSNMLEKPFQLGVKKGNISGVLYGISQMVMFIIFALIFFLGTVFIRDNQSVTV
jgi:ATP-binding cassette subfamily B (MDR/TAP) protein 1